MMRLRSRSYQHLDGHLSVPWYWRMLATTASILILGGFLMLPITFNTDPNIRISSVGLGIFALAILLAGVCASALACIVVRDRSFQATEVFRPALISCAIGFLTVFYNMILSSSYHWSIFSALTVAAAGVGAVIYAILLIRISRKTNTTLTRSQSIAPSVSVSQYDNASTVDESSRYQPSAYYQNYIKNMYPTASAGYDTTTTASPLPQPSITEEEMQRQQMLMLLLRQDQTNAESSSNTFKIEWQSQDHETPIARLAPSNTMNSSTSYSQSQYGSVPSSVNMRVPSGLIPWDGVWRGIEPRPSNHGRPGSREDRRREIEMGA